MVRTLRALAYLFLGLSLSAVPSRAADSGSRRILVFSAAVPPARRVALARQSGAQVVRELPLINAVVIEIPAVRFAAASADAGLSALSGALSGVARVEADPKINWLSAMGAPGADFALPDMAALRARMSALKLRAAAETATAAAAPEAPWGVARVQAPQAWGRTRGEGVSVCVIDTGIDRTHPDLSANVKGGWNAIAKSDDFNDDNGHGSHVAGTIAAAGTGGAPVVIGVAPKASLYGVKVLDSEGNGTIDDVIAGMQWAVDHRMQVVNMSMGAPEGSRALADMTAAMAKAGIVLVAAAGNYHPINNPNKIVEFPGAYPEAIAVAASDKQDALADYSSRGPAVALIAPGSDIRSTFMKGGYETLSGTSMASPHVAGLAALYLASHPGAGPSQVRAALIAAASKLPGVIAQGQGAGLPVAPALVR